jgi:hypothetical protein
MNEYEELLWNVIYRETRRTRRNNVSQCHFRHDKSHMDWTGHEHVPQRWEFGGLPPEPWDDLEWSVN